VLAARGLEEVLGQSRLSELAGLFQFAPAPGRADRKPHSVARLQEIGKEVRVHKICREAHGDMPAQVVVEAAARAIEDNRIREAWREARN